MQGEGSGWRGALRLALWVKLLARSHRNDAIPASSKAF